MQVHQLKKKDALCNLNRLDEKMRERLKWSDIKLLRSLLIFLGMQSWAKRFHQQATAADSDNEDELDDDHGDD